MICSILGHRRSRRAWHDTIEYRSTCVVCGAPMVLDAITNKWRRFRAEDHSPHRGAKPQRAAKG